MSASRRIPPSVAQIREEALESARENARNAEHRADRSYVTEFNNFKRWVDTMRSENQLPAGNEIFTREIVDLHFSRSVAFRLMAR